MTTATAGYRLINEDRRISAVDDQDVEICGAYCPEGHEYWTLFVTKTVTRVTGLTVPPHREHFWGDHGRIDALRWVELVACLVALAVKSAH